MNKRIQTIDLRTDRNISFDYTLVSGYKHFNFAFLRTNGISHIFDTMRYDRAFFVRPSDVENLIAISQGEPPRLLSYTHILLAQYNFSRKSDWTPNRLMSTQEFDELGRSRLVDDWSSNGNYTIPEPPKKTMKIRADGLFTGNLTFIMQMMLLNRAVPANESDSYAIERLFSTGEAGVEIPVTLTNFMCEEADWKLPPI